MGICKNPIHATTSSPFFLTSANIFSAMRQGRSRRETRAVVAPICSANTAYLTRLPFSAIEPILVTMTSPTTTPRPRKPAPAPSTRHWRLQDAKARFSEVVRLAQSDGPQHVTVHGREQAVVVGADDFRRLVGEQTGQALIDVMQACPLADVAFERTSVRSPVRPAVKLDD